jgi:hypothetical protein
MKRSLLKAFMQILALSAVNATNTSTLEMLGESTLMPHNTTDGLTFASGFTQIDWPATTNEESMPEFEATTNETDKKSQVFGIFCTLLFVVGNLMLEEKQKARKFKKDQENKLQSASYEGNVHLVKKLLKVVDSEAAQRFALMQALARVNLRPHNIDSDLTYPIKGSSLYTQYSKIIGRLFNSIPEEQKIHLFTSNKHDPIKKAIYEYYGNKLDWYQGKNFALDIQKFISNVYTYKMKKALSKDPNQKSMIGTVNDVLNLIGAYLQPEGDECGVISAIRRQLTFSDGAATKVNSQQTENTTAMLESTPVTVAPGM